MSKTWKELIQTVCYLNSIDFIEPLDEPIGSDGGLWYSKWILKDADIFLFMNMNGKIVCYKKNHTYPPKHITIEEIISNESLDKKSRARLVWLIGEFENNG